MKVAQVKMKFSILICSDSPWSRVTTKWDYNQCLYCLHMGSWCRFCAFSSTVLPWCPIVFLSWLTHFHLYYMVIYIYFVFITDIESIKSSYGASILEKAALKWVFALYNLWGIFIDSFSNPKTVIVVHLVV